MNREIKFRAWDLNDKVMRYSSDFGSWQRLCVWSEENASELMQYTGLKDKKGTEIYEGDIVFFEGVVSPHSEKYCVVSLERDGYGDDWGCLYMLGYDTKFETGVVVGNIYENVELVENK
jgi:uncharacterized phage protein (TIGR01671 family)